MNKFKQEYLRQVMKFKEQRIELTERQRKFLEYSLTELRDRIDRLTYQWLYRRMSHDPAPHSEISRLNMKSYQITNIINTNSYDLNQRTLLLKLRNYHLKWRP